MPKKCSKCSKTKALSKFKYRAKSDYLQAQCKQCDYGYWAEWVKGPVGRAAQKRERIKQKPYMKKWKNLNPDKVIQYNKNFREKTDDSYFQVHRLRRIERQNRACLLPKYQVAVKKLFNKAKRLGIAADHIIPLAGKLISGLNVPWNIQLIDNSLNRRKSNWFCAESYKNWLKDPSKPLIRP